MKTVLRILVILLVASVVAGAFSLAVSHTSTASDLSQGGGPEYVMTNGDNQTVTRLIAGPVRSDRESVSVTDGLAGVLATLAKLMGITLLVLFAQKMASLLENRWRHPSQM